MSHVKVYVTTFCPYCVAAKRYLTRKNIEFETIDLTGDHEKRIWLMERTGMRTVPQIFVGEHAIGGYTDMVALDEKGGLQPLLDEVGAA